MWSKSSSLSNWSSSPAPIKSSQQPQLDDGNNAWGSVPIPMGPAASSLQPQPQNPNGSGQQVPGQDPFVVKPLNQYSNPAAVMFRPTNNYSNGSGSLRSGARFHPYQSRSIHQEPFNNMYNFAPAPSNSQPTYAPAGPIFQPVPHQATMNSTVTAFQTTPPTLTRSSMSPSSGSQGTDPPQTWSSIPSPPAAVPPPSNLPGTTPHTVGRSIGPIRTQQKFSFSDTPGFDSSIWVSTRDLKLGVTATD